MGELVVCGREVSIKLHVHLKRICTLDYFAKIRMGCLTIHTGISSEDHLKMLFLFGWIHLPHGHLFHISIYSYFPFFVHLSRRSLVHHFYLPGARFFIRHISPSSVYMRNSCSYSTLIWLYLSWLVCIQFQTVVWYGVDTACHIYLITMKIPARDFAHSSSITMIHYPH